MNLQDYAKRIKQLQKDGDMDEKEAEHYLEGIDIIND